MSRSENRKAKADLHIRCMEDDKKLLQEKARVAGLSLSTFMVRAGLGRRMVNKSDTRMIAELNRLGALQKHLFLEGKRTGDKEYSEVLSAIREAVFSVIRSSNKDDVNDHFIC
jgi:acyl CoA:acetate/3-ketoacid CoA transferase alpha subunit